MNNQDRNWLWKPDKAVRKNLRHGEKVFKEACKKQAETYKNVNGRNAS